MVGGWVCKQRCTEDQTQAPPSSFECVGHMLHCLPGKEWDCIPSILLQAPAFQVTRVAEGRGLAAPVVLPTLPSHPP